MIDDRPRMAPVLTVGPHYGKSSMAAWISRQPSTNANTLEQKGTKETKNTETVIALVASIRGGQGDGRRLRPARCSDHDRQR